MGLDMWFREDVQRILASTLEVQRNSARSVAALDGEFAAAYQRGFFDALLAVAVAFGIRAPTGVGKEMDPRFRGGDGMGRGFRGNTRGGDL